MQGGLLLLRVQQAAGRRGAHPHARRVVGYSTSTSPTVAGSSLLTAYQEAQRYLAAQRRYVRADMAELERLRAQAPAGSSTARHLARQLRRKELELAFADPKAHARFHDGQVDLTQDVYAEMAYLQWRRTLLPKLTDLATQYKVVGDLFPQALPLHAHTAQLRVNFDNTHWSGAHGQSVPPNWSLLSPTISITTGSPLQNVVGGEGEKGAGGFYSLLMVDLDRPDPSRNAQAEWCHWMVLNIPIQKRITLPGGTSPFYDFQAPTSARRDDNNTSYHPMPPASAPILPGQVIFPWVPMHPNLSNPKREHRYVLTLLRHAQPLSSPIPGDAPTADQPAAKLNERARFDVLPTLRLAQEQEATVATYGFLRSSWNAHTPAIFAKLGLHEPIYGAASREAHLAAQWARQARKATEVAVALGRHPSTLSAEEVRALNAGTFPAAKPFRLPEIGDLRVDQMRAEEAERQAKRQAKASSKGASVPAVPVGEEHRSGRRLPKFSLLGAIAASKAKIALK